MALVVTRTAWGVEVVFKHMHIETYHFDKKNEKNIKLRCEICDNLTEYFITTKEDRIFCNTCYNESSSIDLSQTWGMDGCEDALTHPDTLLFGDMDEIADCEVAS